MAHLQFNISSGRARMDVAGAWFASLYVLRRPGDVFRVQTQLGQTPPDIADPARVLGHALEGLRQRNLEVPVAKIVAGVVLQAHLGGAEDTDVPRVAREGLVVRRAALYVISTLVQPLAETGITASFEGPPLGDGVRNVRVRHERGSSLCTSVELPTTAEEQQILPVTHIATAAARPDICVALRALPGQQGQYLEQLIAPSELA